MQVDERAYQPKEITRPTSTRMMSARSARRASGVEPDALRLAKTAQIQESTLAAPDASKLVWMSAMIWSA